MVSTKIFNKNKKYQTDKYNSLYNLTALVLERVSIRLCDKVHQGLHQGTPHQGYLFVSLFVSFRTKNKMPMGNWTIGY